MLKVEVCGCGCVHASKVACDHVRLVGHVMLDHVKVLTLQKDKCVRFGYTKPGLFSKRILSV